MGGVALSGLHCRSQARAAGLGEYVVAIMIHSKRVLDDADDFLGPFSSANVIQTLAVVLGLPESEIRASVAPGSALARPGVVTLDRGSAMNLRSKLDLLSSSLGEVPMSSDAAAIRCDPSPSTLRFV
jgi:hypothetical protein